MFVLQENKEPVVDRRKNLIGHLAVSLVIISIFLANLPHSGLWYTDAPSHALNGVFYKDMVEEKGFFHPMGYAERYYVQYPSLTVGIYPPVFDTVEALFFKLFGLSPMIPKLAVLFFSLLGVNMFFLLCRLWFPLGLSVVGSILCFLQPGTLFGQRNVMLEMPVLAVSITALYCLYIGIQRNNLWALFFAPVLAALAFLTRQSAIFLLPVWFFLIIPGGKWKLIKSGHLILGVLVGGIILIPWVITNFTIGSIHLLHLDFQRGYIWPNLLYYLKHYSEIVSHPVFILSILSVILFLVLKKYGSYKFALAWGCSALLAALPMKYTEPRYVICLIPALIILSMQVIWFLKEKMTSFSQHRKAYVIVLIALIWLHLNPQKLWGGPDIQGFDLAADFVMKDPDCVSVLYDGYFNGNFIFQIRMRDRDRRIFVFRASKVIFSTKFHAQLGYNELIRGVSEFYDLLNHYSVKYVIQEEKDLLKNPANRRLRQWIEGPKFRLVQEYPIQCLDLPGFGRLLVYEYLDYEARPITSVELDMPVLGRKISSRVETKE
jgi:hypothetical protein